jgi:RNA polymerase sigma-70 factor, ECF subfamily
MDLLRAARKGKQSAFLQLYDDHHRPLFRFAYRLTGSVADAEDIVQDCFLGLLRPECGFDASRTPLRTYLFGAVRNQALSRLRSRAAAGARVETVEFRSPETEAMRKELADTIARSIGQLPDTQREVLLLAHYEQTPLAEIAQVLEIEVTAVKSRLQRARAALKAMLAAYVAGEETQR